MSASFVHTFAHPPFLHNSPLPLHGSCTRLYLHTHSAEVQVCSLCVHTLAHSRVHKHGCTPPEHTSCAPVHMHTLAVHTLGCTVDVHIAPCTHCVCKPTCTHTHSLCARALAHSLVHSQVRSGGAHLCVASLVHCTRLPSICPPAICTPLAFAHASFARGTEALVLARGSTAALGVHTHVQAAAPLTHTSSTVLPRAIPVRAMHTHSALKAPLVRVPWVRMQLLHARVPSPHPRALWNWVKVAAAPMWGTAGPPPGAAPLRI